MPGPALELTGARVDDYTFIGPDDEPGMALWAGDALECPVFNDILAPATGDAKVEAAFTSNYYAGAPALISRPVGKGRAYYFGGAFSEAAAELFLRKFRLDEPYADAFDLPPACELAVREKGGERYAFSLNYTRGSQAIRLRRPLRELLTGSEAAGNVTLAPFGAAVFKL
jgi:beta-galactosidase